MCNKTKFATEKDALDHLKRIQKTSLKVPKLYVYYCTKCKAWNLTKKPLPKDEIQSISVLKAELKKVRKELIEKCIIIKELKKGYDRTK